MGEVQLRRESSHGRDLVYAFLSTGEPVWVMDVVARHEWWYQPELAAQVGPSLRAQASRLLAGDLAAAAGPGPGGDLATHAPGHAVLAQIAELHAAASSQTVQGLPGTLSDEVINWCVGYVGEEQVAAILATLGPDWRILHSVPVGERGSDIDHVLIGPPGVFTINTKHHPGGRVDVKGDAVFVGGRFMRYVDSARLEADRAATVARTVAPDVSPTPLITVVGARLAVKQPPAGVTVLDASRLAGWLRGLPTQLTREQIDAIHARMRWSGHWTRLAPVHAAPGWVVEFARHMAAERATVVSQRQAGRTRPSTSTPRRRASPSPRTRPTKQRAATRPSRRRARSSTPGLRTVALRVLALFVVLMALPHVVTALTHSIASRVPGTSTTPNPAIPTPPAVALPSTPCATEGATGTSPSNRAYVCAANRNGKLVWTRS